jgi:hypothetical protein
MQIENLRSEEKDILLRWFLHYLPMGGEGCPGHELVEVANAAQRLIDRLPKNATDNRMDDLIVALKHADRREGDLTLATRREFMLQFPTIYNKLAGSDIVRVIRVATGDPA